MVILRDSSTGPTVGVLALQGDFREHLRAFERLGVRAQAVRRAAELDAVDALVIPGGESTAMDKLITAFDLREPLQARLAEGMPAYGSCAGMVLLADTLVEPQHYLDGTTQQTLGGIDMAVRRNAFGRQVDSFEEDIDFAGLGDAGESERVRAVFIRAPWVESVGSGVEVLARASDGSGERADRIVAVRSGNRLATSFHPEVTGSGRIHQLFVRMMTGDA
ncbi:pyridoxal 5'-phosphate synthase glutaminase subunit PdxT [Haematomicrobium sanguinis]|uniref:pyridoxal 5'-phosphate synthase glutaminase subunit PdxT n=1 Tax=Haematomicrobium sanguinis TaxID=479106 RepID=UPI00068BD876|nr:pyridoxal 5'-phosphate synthase glutaminase subunit PdxT [Haematomicrobium sanguinis]